MPIHMSASRHPCPIAVRSAACNRLNFVNHLPSILPIASRSFFHAPVLSPTNTTPTVARSSHAHRTIITAKIRSLHPAILPSLLPVFPTLRQFRRDLGPPSTALDRILISVLLLGVLHLFATSRILVLARLLALLWPIIHPLLIASRRNAQLRFSANQSAPLLVAGKLCVRTTSRGTLVRVSDGSALSTYPKPLLTTSSASRYDGHHACALVVGGRVIDVAVANTYLAPYPCVRHRVLNELCTAIYSQA